MYHTTHGIYKQGNKKLSIINISKPLSHPGDEWKPRKLGIDGYIPNEEDNIITTNDNKRKDKNIINNRLKHKNLY